MSSTTSAAAPTRGTGPGVNLALAAWVFAITFWAWNIIGPLAVRYTEDLGLSATQKSLLIATPVLVGAVGRVPVGALTDRFGGRRMLSLLCFASVVPVLLVAWAGTMQSYPLLLVFGFFLGIAGTSFASGIPFVNAWYEPPDEASLPACSASAWVGPRCRRSSRRASSDGSATCPRT